MRSQNLHNHIFFIIPCKDFLIFKYVLQVILALNEEVATRCPRSSMERKASGKQTQVASIQDCWSNKQFYSKGLPIWATLTADTELYSYLIK